MVPGEEGGRRGSGGRTVTPSLTPLLLLLALTLPPVTPLWLGECGGGLGLESGLVPDAALTASSIWTDVVGPHNGRLNVDRKGGAWCPKGQLNQSSREYLQVDLGAVHVITATGTQGRFANGNGREYAEEYKLEYWRPGMTSFRVYTSGYGNQTFRGNVNTYLGQHNPLSPPVLASKVRFVPVSIHPRTVCLRVEVYGCNTTGGVVGYSGLGGVRRDPGYLLEDDTYDGTTKAAHLDNGLGQLYDGETGRPLRNLQLQGYGRGKGWEWVGWSRKEVGEEPLTLTFTFDLMRNFTSLAILAFHSPEDDFMLPTRIEIHFGYNDSTFHSTPLHSNVSLNPTLGAHNLTLQLHHRTARILKLLLHFPGPWLAISELYFDSEPCVCNLSTWADRGSTSQPAERTADPHAPEHGKATPHDVSTVSAVHAHTRAYMGILIGLVVGVFVLVFAGLLLYVSGVRKKKSSPPVHKSQLSKSPSATYDLKSLRLTSSSYSQGGGVPSMYGLPPLPTPDGQSGGVEGGEGGSLYHEPYRNHLISASEYSVATIGRHLSDFSTDGNQNLAATQTLTGTQNPHQNAHQRYSASEYSVATIGRHLSDFGGEGNQNIGNGVGGVMGGEYAIPLLSTPPPPPFTSSTPTAPPQTPTALYSTAPAPPSTLPPTGFPSLLRLPPPPPVPPPPHNYSSPPTIAVGVGVVGGCGVGQYRVEGLTGLKPRSPRELPRGALTPTDKLGDGQFGTVHLGDVSGVGEGEGTRQVVLARLNDDATPEVREDGWRQAQLLATLSDPNLASLLGVVSRDDPLVLVLEYLDQGDLNQYLRHHVPDTTTPRLNHMRPISYGMLVYMATQVAAGMKYLETHHITHRDLATRNVLVGAGNVVKVSCVGSCRSLYSGDYHIPPGAPETRIPVRWMSWEAIFLGHFSSRSDVWSFGVTLWEMLTLARSQPHESMSDEAVIDNLTHYYHDDGQQVLLPQPMLCPKEIYDLMRECWRRDEADRPNFRDIHVFLQRKNHGYSPQA